jgi:hypothetical protein
MSVHLASPVATWVGSRPGAGASPPWSGETPGGPRIGKAARPIVALRTVSMLLLLLAFANPTVVSAVPPEHRPCVFFLLDASASMNVPDGRRGSRLDECKRVGREVTALLCERFTVETFSVGAGATRVDGPDRLDGAGTATDLGAALRAVLADGLEPPAAVVLASDGIDTVASTDPRLPCPVIAVPLGTDLTPRRRAHRRGARPERADCTPPPPSTSRSRSRARRSARGPLPRRYPRARQGDDRHETATLDAGGRGTCASTSGSTRPASTPEARVGPVPTGPVRRRRPPARVCARRGPVPARLVLAGARDARVGPCAPSIARMPGVLRRGVCASRRARC